MDSREHSKRKEIVRRILSGQSGEDASWCGICLAEIEDVKTRYNDVVRLTYPVEKEVLFLEIVDNACGLMPQDSMYSHVFCTECTSNAINAFVLRLLSSQSQNLWLHTQKTLLSCKLDGVYKNESVYLVLGEESTVTTSLLKLKRNKNKVVQCQNCMKLLSSETSLKRHKCKQTNHECTQCKLIFPTRSKLILHFQRFHSKKIVRCEHCQKMYASERLLREHTKAMHTPGKCTICSKEFQSRKSLREHERTHAISWICTCGKYYKYRNGLRLHQRRCEKISDKVPKYECPKCNKSYTFKHSLLQHIDFDHGNNPIQCKQCKKHFRTNHALRNHMSKHTGIKNYKCEHCNTEFVSSTTLKCHIRSIHTGEKPFQCEECQQSFVTSSRKLEHKRKVHGAPAPSCLACGLRFVNMSCLRRHIRKFKHSTAEIITTNFHIV